MPKINLNFVPDFDDMMRVTLLISDTYLEKEIREIELEDAKSKVFKECMTNTIYFQRGKAPSVSFVESMYGFSGLNGELIPLREKLAEVSSKLESLKLTFQVYRDILSLYQVESANKRASVTW